MVSIIIVENDTNFIEKMSIVFAFYFVFKKNKKQKTLYGRRACRSSWASSDTVVPVMHTSKCCVC